MTRGMSNSYTNTKHKNYRQMRRFVTGEVQKENGVFLALIVAQEQSRRCQWCSIHKRGSIGEE